MQQHSHKICKNIKIYICPHEQKARITIGSVIAVIKESQGLRAALAYLRLQSNTQLNCKSSNIFQKQFEGYKPRANNY